MSDDIVRIGLKVDSKQVKEGAEALDDLGNASDSTEKKTNKLTRSQKQHHIAMTAVKVAAVALTAAMTYSIIKSAEFSAAVSDLSAITGATGKDLKFLSDEAKRFGATTTLSATEAAGAFKLIASAKPDLLDNAVALSMVTKEVITLSEASGTDLANAANTVGNALNQFGAEADQASRFVNVLAAGSKFGSSAVEDTAEALKNAGAVASNAGLSFEQTNAAIQGLASMAIKGGEAGTGLRGVLLKLTTQTNDDFNPKIVGFTKAIKNLEQAELSDVEMKKLFGQESITAALALIKQAESLDTLTGKLTGTNTAMEQASTRNDNLTGDMKAFWSATEGAAIALGTQLEPFLREVAKASTEAMRALTGFIELFAEVPEETKQLIALTDQYYAQQQMIEMTIRVKGEGSKAHLRELRELDDIEKKIQELTKVRQEEAAAASSPVTPDAPKAERKDITLNEDEAVINEWMMKFAEKEREANQRRIDEEVATQETILAWMITYEDRKTQVAKQAADARLALTSGALGALSSLLATRGKRSFEISKGLAVAETIVSTYAAAQKAYESQLSIPTPDAPARAAVAAGIAIAGGLARVAAINSTSYGGGGGSAPSQQSTSAGYTQPTGNEQATRGGAAGGLNLEFKITGDPSTSPETLQKFTDALVNNALPQIKDALTRGQGDSLRA